jgi:shikimate dehydrogenase
MHNAAFRRAGLDWVYLSFPVPPESLKEAVTGLRALGARGANVTMPHKEKVLPLLDEVSGDAAAVGAVNTIQELGGRLIGHNTDVDGFRIFVEADAGFDASGSSVLILGAGGAARAVARALDDLGAARTKVAARDKARAEEVAGLARSGEGVDWAGASGLARDCDVIVNATPLGTAGENPLEERAFRPGQLVVDLIYAPPSTPLVEMARREGADAWGGVGMLVHQAAASWRIWTGQEPPVEVMSAAAIHALGGPRLRG